MKSLLVALFPTVRNRTLKGSCRRALPATWLAALAGLAMPLTTAMADYVRVSQDSGYGFDVKGFVKVFDRATTTAASLYGYTTGGPSAVCYVSYSGTVFNPTDGITTLAVIDTSEGTTLFVVHDRPGNPGQGPACQYADPDSTGGSSDNTYESETGNLYCMVKDGDSNFENNDTYRYCGGDYVEVEHLWNSHATDGIVLGTLEGAWRLYMGYMSDPIGINSVTVVGADGANITGLTPSTGTTIRLDHAAQVDIDIKPGSDPNCFNVDDHGVIPVAIFGSAAFDVSSIDSSTLKFAGMAVRVRGNNNPQCSLKDSDEDGFTDLVCPFVDDAGAWSAGDTTAELWGELDDSTPFFGEDAICIRP